MISNSLFHRASWRRRPIRPCCILGGRICHGSILPRKLCHDALSRPHQVNGERWMLSCNRMQNGPTKSGTRDRLSTLKQIKKLKEHLAPCPARSSQARTLLAPVTPTPKWRWPKLAITCTSNRSAELGNKVTAVSILCFDRNGYIQQ